MSTGAKVTLIVLCGLAVIGAVFGGIFYLVASLTAPIKELATTFEEAIAASDAPAAYDTFSGALKEQITEPELEAMFKDIGIWGKDGDFFFNSRGFQNSEGYAEGTWTGPDGTVFPVRLSFIWENEAWKIIAFRFSPSGT